MGTFTPIAALLCCAFAVRGQPDAVFSTDVKVVNLLASVRSKQGAYVRDLTREDFLLSEDGGRRPSATSRNRRICP